jgi:hydrogenase/urease accessory protein HupE
VTIHGSYECEAEPGTLKITTRFHESIGARHRCYAWIQMVERKPETLRFVFDPAETTFLHNAGKPRSRIFQHAVRFLWLGVEHIFIGADHLAFLLGLLLLAGGLKRVVIIVTAFTVAHSITLALAALGKVSLSPAVVEPLIAASILYIGVENLVVKESRWRWALAFGFGLVHGFGFAGVLAELGLPTDALATALVCFNVGVEIGQVLIVIALLGTALGFNRLLKGKPASWYSPWGMRILSAMIAGAGAYWLLQRTVLA